MPNEPKRPATTGDPDAPRRDGERRPAKRLRKRLMVRYGVDEANKMGFTKNISETGIFIRTNTVFRPGTTVHVQVQFPERTFSYWGRVAWAKQVPTQLAHVLECGMGVSFIEPPGDWLEFYRKWTES